MTLMERFKDLKIPCPKYLNGKFEAYTDFGRIGCSEYMNSRLVEKSIRNLKLGEPYYSPFDGTKSVAGEWGYTFLNLNGVTDGSGLSIQGAGWKEYHPATREEALKHIKTWLFEQYKADPYRLNPGDSAMGSLNGHCHYQHYACEWGFDYVGAEIGENVASHQAHLAFTRGAAKQYRKIGFLYFSDWYQTTIGSWEEYSSWPGFTDQNGGHSISLLKRSYIMSYMGGLSCFNFEAGGRLAFKGPGQMTPDGCFALSPYGEAMQELVAFSDRNPDVGISYVPIAIVLDYYHGISGHVNGGVTQGKSHNYAFGFFPNTALDDMTWKIFEMYYPGGGLFGGYNKPGMPTEETYQVNTPFGDTCDVLLQNADVEILNSYPCLLFSGNIRLTEEEAGRYEEYVQNGGTLLLNTAYLDQFPCYRALYTGERAQTLQVGLGQVIVYGPDGSVEELREILRKQLSVYVPFTFSADVEYLINVKENSWIVTVIHNDGIKKEKLSEPEIDMEKTIPLTITYTGSMKVQSVRSLCSDQFIKTDGQRAEVILRPGEYRVFEFMVA